MCTPAVDSRSSLPNILCGYMTMPSSHPYEGGNSCDVVFEVPRFQIVRVDGQNRPTIVLPLYIQDYPRVWFPGIKVPRGLRMKQVWHEGDWQMPTRRAEFGQLFVNNRTAIPIRFVSVERALMEDGTELVLKEQHVRFRIGEEFEVGLPDEGL
jgi:hypothetical protein